MRLSNHSQVLHIARRDSISSLSDLGWFGSNRSKKVTSPIDKLYHISVIRNIAHISHIVGLGALVSLYSADFKNEL
jgi:hypothetical protein